MESKKKPKKKRTRRPLADVQAPVSARLDHSTPHAHQVNLSSQPVSPVERVKPQQQDTFGFDDIDSPPPEPSVTPIRAAALGTLTPASIMSTSTIDSPVQDEKFAGKARSYLVKSAFKREAPLIRRRRSPQKRVRKRLIEEKDVSLLLCLL